MPAVRNAGWKPALPLKGARASLPALWVADFQSAGAAKGRTMALHELKFFGCGSPGRTYSWADHQAEVEEL